MWEVVIGTKKKPSQSLKDAKVVNHVLDNGTKSEIIQFLHAACFSPVPSTWKKAIKAGYFNTWPGVTTQLIDKHLPTSEATIKGHKDQLRNNIKAHKTTRQRKKKK